MLVRMQRRRISPRARRRCLAIRGFFRKALDTCTTASQFFTRDGSAIKHNLSEKMEELDQKLNSLNSASFDEKIADSGTIIVKMNNNINELTDDNAHGEFKTEILYKTSEHRYKRCSSPPSQNSKTEIIEKQECNEIPNVVKAHQNKGAVHHKSSYNLPTSANSVNVSRKYSAYYEENKQYIKNHRTKRHKHRKSEQMVFELIEERNKPMTPNKKYRKKSHLSKQNSEYNNTDQHRNHLNIADMIRKQYDPVGVVERRISEISNFSVPICRDVNSTEDNEHQQMSTDKDKYSNNVEAANIATCEKSKHKHHRKTNVKEEQSRNSDLYDFIPVKEKSTPRSRRKFAEEQMILNSLHREVPPSPRTNRPRLNLTVSHFGEYGNDVDIEETETYNCTNEVVESNPNEDCSNNYNKQNNSMEKTDDTLIEIKETLQRFLQEVRKGNSVNGISDGFQAENNFYGPNNAMLPILNSCYYPFVPICPINYMQSAFVPSNSTCAACAKSNDSKGTVAEQLIKQIHQGAAPILYNKQYESPNLIKDVQSPSTIPQTSRSAGSGKVRKNCSVDEQIPTLKCKSNSTATIGSKIISKDADMFSKASFSDSELDNLSTRLIHTMVGEDAVPDFKQTQNKHCTFKKFFKSFGSIKKCSTINKVIEERLTPLPAAKHLHGSPRTVFNYQEYDENGVSNASHLHDKCLKKYHLKEVEIKSIATQSEWPKRFFGMISYRQSGKIIYASKRNVNQNRRFKWFRFKSS